MSLRQLPGALILGLLASLIAHAVGFGSGHTEAGAYHAVLDTLALVGAGGSLLAALCLAFGSCGPRAQGSVLAVRLRAWMPDVFAVVIAGSLWFAAIESLEPAHGVASIALVIGAMLAASWMLCVAVATGTRLLARCALVISKVLAAPLPVFVLRRYLAPARVSPHLSRRIVTRPPPRSVSSIPTP